MSFWLINCIAVFLLCVFCAGIVIPQILLIAFRKQLMDVPDERKIHRSLVPRLGGIAFKPVVFFSMALIYGINFAAGNLTVLTTTVQDLQSVLFGFCSIMVLYLVGMADDLVGVKYRAKFVVQVLCAIMLIAGGIYLGNLHGVFWIHDIPTWLAYPLTVLVVVFLINAINLIDGIDGLASGLCGIASFIYGVIFYKFGSYFYAMLSFSTLGVLVPFFYYNVFGNPEKRQKIFMGDTGSLTIGMMLSILSLKLAMIVPPDVDVNYNAMILAFVPLLIPSLDVIRVYLYRIRNKKNPFLPDKSHIHHKLLALGMKQRRAMISIISFSLFLSLANIFLSRYINVNILLIGDVVVWTVLNIKLSKMIAERKAKAEVENNTK